MDPNLLAGLMGGKGGGKGGGGLDPAMLQGLAGLLGGKGGGKGDSYGGADGDGGAGGLGGMGEKIWDNPMVRNIAFHPSAVQPEFMEKTSGPIRDGVFKVADGDTVSYRLYLPSGEVKVVVYFWHGNAEVCTAVDHVKDMFLGCDAAVLSLDYRGYSWGTGQPSLGKLCGDALACFAASLPLLDEAGCGAAKRVAMGRSIGATCAVHLAAKRAGKIHGLVIDSGLMSLKGLPMVASMGPMVMGGPEAFANLKEPFDTLGSLEAISCPLLVMHGKRDEIVPFSQAVDCHTRCPSQDKTLKEWPNAGHNDVTLTYGTEWAQAVTELIGKAATFTEPFPAGVLVEAHSLSVEALNGLQGRVLGPQAERYRIKFPDPNGEKALKAANLKVIAEDTSDAPDEYPIGATVEAHSLSNNDFNGMRGNVLGPQGDRVSVEFPEPHGVKALKPVNLKIIRD
eukprot:TRINITY_DN6455_c1_g1_i1.p1 TRINITY_DN6455_c1_g1~~TRINITY_DN6455_c1_g1_i1.p1  ORF type:complete len:452 (+),score=97.67 TRINITY_DN6455_c1_g1_i1:48-1403(+)